MYRKSLITIGLEAKRKRCSAMREAKERKRIQMSESLRDVGGIITDGCLGVHHIRLMVYPDDARAVAVVVDGMHRRPRSMRGLVRCLAMMIFARMNTETTNKGDQKDDTR